MATTFESLATIKGAGLVDFTLGKKQNKIKKSVHKKNEKRNKNAPINSRKMKTYVVEASFFGFSFSE